jgi:hypothetical protein
LIHKHPQIVSNFWIFQELFDSSKKNAKRSKINSQNIKQKVHDDIRDIHPLIAVLNSLVFPRLIEYFHEDRRERGRKREKVRERERERERRTKIRTDRGRERGDGERERIPRERERER